VADQEDSIRQAITACIRAEMGHLRGFVDRRIAELREQIAGVIAMPAAATRNSGLELEAVVQATEAAANRIMEAAEAISDWLREGSMDPAAVSAVGEKVNTIFEACTFQDVTGQRIRRTIEHLQHVESMLTDIVPDGGAATATARASPDQGPDLRQDSVDELFGATAAVGPAMGQNDVDNLFA
jgi:chemotaxis protein CheZ